MIMLSALMLARNIYIVVLIFYAIFCLPCYCFSDNCCLKRALKIKDKGVSFKVLEYLEKEQWVYENKDDFKEYAALQ